MRGGGTKHEYKGGDGPSFVKRAQYGTMKLTGCILPQSGLLSINRTLCAVCGIYIEGRRRGKDVTIEPTT